MPKKKKNRISIPPEVAAEVMFKSHKTCCVCRKERLPVQIHHIDDDPSNNAEENLVVLCTVCHDDTQLKGGFGRKLNAELVKKYRSEWETIVAALPSRLQTSPTPTASEINGNSTSETDWEIIDHGIFRNKDGRHRITIHPTVFFSDRMTSTFPGLRGLRVFDKSTEAIARLMRLLRTPTGFDAFEGHGIHSDPIWWFRNFSGLPIENVEIVQDGVILMGWEELKISRIAAFNSNAYYQAFVYVEVDGMEQTGIYSISQSSIENSIRMHRYATEEYAIFEGNPIHLDYYDDGYMEKDDTIINVQGAKRRLRHLSKYNFLIAPKTSPMNDQRLEAKFGAILDNILIGESDIDALAELMSGLPKSTLDD